MAYVGHQEASILTILNKKRDAEPKPIVCVSDRTDEKRNLMTWKGLLTLNPTCYGRTVGIISQDEAGEMGADSFTRIMLCGG